MARVGRASGRDGACDAGALSVLPIALTYRAGLHVHAGEFEAAEALIEEAEGITVATGEPPLRYTSLVLAAWRGQEGHALQVIEAGVRDAMARGEGTSARSGRVFHRGPLQRSRPLRGPASPLPSAPVSSTTSVYTAGR